jgi:salicylate hydroxylase
MTRIAVVGAGIAGLVAAAALQRHGVRGQVFEQTRHLREIGAGIQVSPNGSRVLHRLGLGATLARVATRPAALEVRRWDDGSLLARSPLGDTCEAAFGFPYYTIHRADLHQSLLELVTEGTVHLGKRCLAVDQDPDAVRLKFDDGTTTAADLVIGADGIRSAVRRVLVDDEPRYSGHTMYRGLVPADRVPHLAGEPRITIWLGPGQHCVCYPVSGGRQFSFAASAPCDTWHVESWSAAADSADLLAAYRGWHDDVLGVLSAAGGLTRWALHDRPPVPTWTGDRLVLVGDAAHPMLPFGAQGASQAIEDTAALVACLDGVAPSGLAAALARYERVRQPRVARVRRFIAANESSHHLDDGQDQRRRDESIGDEWRLREREWLFGYDAEGAARGNNTRGEQESWATTEQLWSPEPHRA